MKRYNKYDEGKALHWVEYKKDGNHKRLVDDSLVPFEDIQKGTLLDVGCGDGLTACKLAQAGFRVTGVDPEIIGIGWAKKKCGEDVEWVCTDIEEFLKQERSFDYLYCLNTIEHLSRPEVLVEAMKLVRRFGIIVTDDGEVREKKSKYHKHEFTRQEFKELFTNFNLEEIPILHELFFGYKISNPYV